jgi:hypothetical protein
MGEEYILDNGGPNLVVVDDDKPLSSGFLDRVVYSLSGLPLGLLFLVESTGDMYGS